MSTDKHSMTMAEFRKQLALYPDNCDVCFAVDGIRLHFMRAKSRGDDLVQLEFNEIDEFPLKSSKTPGSKSDF
jgi:hypothetical protein